MHMRNFTSTSVVVKHNSAEYCEEVIITLKYYLIESSSFFYYQHAVHVSTCTFKGKYSKKLQ